MSYQNIIKYLGKDSDFLLQHNSAKPLRRNSSLRQKMSSLLCSDHPIYLCLYKVANRYVGRIDLINSEGKSSLQELVRISVINKRAEGMGLSLDCQAFQQPLSKVLKCLMPFRLYIQQKRLMQLSIFTILIDIWKRFVFKCQLPH